MTQEIFPGTLDALNSLSIFKPIKFEDVSQEELDDEIFFETMTHFDNLKKELGYETVWSIYDGGAMPLDQKLFNGENYLVKYKCIKDLGDTLDDTTWVIYTAVAKNGTIAELWKAAESCYQQAVHDNGDWHYFIENFEIQDDGSLELVTGS